MSDYEYDIITEDGQLSEYAANRLDTLVDVIKQSEMELKLFKVALKDAMEFYGVTSLKTSGHTYTYVNEATRTSFDSKKLKTEDPDTYEKYLKTSKVSAHVVIK